MKGRRNVKNKIFFTCLITLVTVVTLFSSLALSVNAAAGAVIVVYNGSGHTGGSVPASHIEITPGTFTVKDQGDMIKTGYTFAGWKSESDRLYKPGSYSYTTAISGTFELTAEWTQNTATGAITVVYDGNGHTGGSIPASHTEITPGTFAVKDQGNMIKSGCTFVGWKSESETLYKPGSYSYTTAINGTFELTAEWTRNTTPGAVTVVYDGNGHTSGSVPAGHTEITPGTFTIKNQGDMIKTGYDFVGWKNGNGTLYKPGSYSYSTAITGMFALTADWTINKTLNVAAVKQDSVYGCWAAVAYMMRRYEKISGLTQAQIAEKYQTQINGSGSQSSIVKALKEGGNSTFSNAKYLNLDSSTYNELVVNQILANKPVQVLCAPIQGSGLGHSYLIIGIRNDKVIMIDPWDGITITKTKTQLLTTGFTCKGLSGNPLVKGLSVVIY